MPSEPEIPDEHLWCVDLHLTRQEPCNPVLHCVFCGKGDPKFVEWEFSFRPEGTGTLLSKGLCEDCRTKLRALPAPKREGAIMHVDDFINNHREPAYARFVLDYFRKSAVNHAAFRPFMEKHLLFCTYQDTVGGGATRGRYRVTGASRLGDIWLSKDFKREVGYELRVNVAYCIEWSGQP